MQQKLDLSCLILYRNFNLCFIDFRGLVEKIVLNN